MTTLVTGATGFVGLNIVEALLDRQEEVIALGLGRWPAEADRLIGANGLLQVVDGDLRDQDAIERLFQGRTIDRVIHGAAITAGVEREKSDPQSIVDVNVGGTANVIQAAHRHGTGRIVHLSSGAAYGDSLFMGDLLREEETPSRPVTLYGLTKFAGERLALRLRQLYQLDLVCTRLGSVFGPWEHATNVRDNLSVFLQLAQLAAAGTTAIVPQPTPRKDYVYSRDVALGVVALLEAKDPPHSLYHLTSGWEWGDPVVGWCQTLEAAYPGFAHRENGPGEGPNIKHTELEHRTPMDTTLIKTDIGFSPHYSEAQAFDDYAAWLAGVPGWLDPARAKGA